jgi:hypothetical protein
MKRSYSYLLLLGAPILVMLTRVPLVLRRTTLYGFDPFSHLYFIRQWIADGGWPLLHFSSSTLPNDYGAWPGAHIIVAALSILTGIDPMDLMAWLPTILLGIMDLAIVLACVKKIGPWFAFALGLLFGSADQIFVQSQWYVPELVGLVLASFLVLNEFKFHSPVISGLLLTTNLMIHHFSFLLTLMIWLMICRKIFTKKNLIVLFVVLTEVLVFWTLATKYTGSFPDISSHSGGIPLTYFVVIMVVALLSVRASTMWFYDRFFKSQSNSRMQKAISTRFGKLGHIGVPLVIGLLLVGVLWAYAFGVKRFDGLGFQPTKILVLVGVLLYIWNVPFKRFSLRITSAFVLIYLLLMLNPILFKFIPLMTRWLDFLYFMGFPLLAIGAYYFGKRSPKLTEVLFVSMLFIVPVLMIDDGLRYNSDASKRFELTQDDVIFAEGVNNHTEPKAIILGPPNLGSLLFGVGERWVDTGPSISAVKAGNYTVAMWIFEEDAGKEPTYLVHSSRRLNYMTTESDTITDQQIDSLTASLSSPEMKPRLTLIYEHGDEQLYKFSKS